MVLSGRSDALRRDHRLGALLALERTLSHACDPLARGTLAQVEPQSLATYPGDQRPAFDCLAVAPTRTCRRFGEHSEGGSPGITACLSEITGATVPKCRPSATRRATWARLTGQTRT